VFMEDDVAVRLEFLKIPAEVEPQKTICVKLN
ncbi:jg2205, partial [Pararge aegeria aegeria]